MKNEVNIKRAVYKLCNAADRLKRYIETDEAKQSEIRDYLSIINEYALSAAAELSTNEISYGLKGNIPQ